MGRIKYQKLGHLNIDHEYFANGYARAGFTGTNDLILFPLLTSKNLEALGLRVTSLRQNSLTVYGEVEPSTIPGEEKYYLNKLSKHANGVIYFALIPLNHQYALASDLPLDRAQDECLLLSNRNIGNGKDTLCKGAKINWPTDAMKVHTGNYLYIHPEKLRKDEAVLIERDSKTVVHPDKIILNTNSSTELVFNQDQIKPGYYQLVVKNQQQPEQFLLGNWSHNFPLAILELAWGPDLAPEARLWEDDFVPKPTPPTFKGIFLARKARWKYTFLFSTLANPQAGGPPVISNVDLKMDDQAAFTPEAVNDPAKEARFISDSDLPFEEIPQRKLSLSYKVGGQNGRSKPIKVPTVENLHTTTGNQIQTHISITL